MFDLSSLLNSEEIKKKLTEQAKNDIMEWIGVKVIPTAEDAIEAVNTELREQAKSESGWLKIRDAFFIPLVLSIILWAFKQMNSIISNETMKKE